MHQVSEQHPEGLCMHNVSENHPERGYVCSRFLITLPREMTLHMLEVHPDSLCAPFIKDSCLEAVGLEMVQEFFPEDFLSNDLLLGLKWITEQ